KDSKGWRDHNVLEFAQNDADRLTVEAGGAKLVLEKLAPEKEAPKPVGDAKWKIVESSGDAPKTSDVLDVAMVNGAVQSLASLKAVDSADDKKPAEPGLDKPWLKVTARAAGKEYAALVEGQPTTPPTSRPPTARPSIR